MAEAVRNDEVDLSIGVNLGSRKIAGSEFFLLFEDYYSFYISTKIMDDKMTLPLLLHPNADDAFGVNVETHVTSLITKRGAHRIHNFETLKTLTLQGLGIGILPTQVANHCCN